MEASLAAVCSRASLPSSCVNPALEFLRTLAAKKANLGVSNGYKSVLCLHIAAAQDGKSVDIKQMVKLAGAKSKPHYLSIYQNAEKILELDQVMSVQEVCVQLGVSHMAESASKILNKYETHMHDTFGKNLCETSANFGRPVFPCAAVSAACKIASEKFDHSKLIDISRAKKSELLALSDNMFNLQPTDNGKKGTRKKLDFMDKIMGVNDDAKENVEDETDGKVRSRVKEEDFEDDGYEDWKQMMLKKAVEDGYSKYRKYLKIKN